MELILLQRIEKLGQMGDIVKVKPGFGRNFLLPTGKAVRATAENIEDFKQKKSQIEANNLRLKKEAEVVAEKLQGLEVVVLRSAGETGHLYGSIRPQDIVEQIKKQGFSVDRSQVCLTHPLKVLGIHKLRIVLHSEVSVEIYVNVALTQEEAHMQSQARLKGQSTSQS